VTRPESEEPRVDEHRSVTYGAARVMCDVGRHDHSCRLPDDAMAVSPADAPGTRYEGSPRRMRMLLRRLVSAVVDDQGMSSGAQWPPADPTVDHAATLGFARPGR
jgi:hypothetical protein